MNTKSAAEASGAPAAEPEDEHEVDFSLRVLAAEDNAANRQVLRLLLRQVGIDPVFAEDGAEAVEAVRSEAFDLILMDANMPRMDGASAVRALREMEGPVASTPIHMLTANVFDDDKARYREAGADGVIAKPIIVSELYAVLSAVACRAAQRQAAA